MPARNDRIHRVVDRMAVIHRQLQRLWKQRPFLDEGLDQKADLGVPRARFPALIMPARSYFQSAFATSTRSKVAASTALASDSLSNNSG